MSPYSPMTLSTELNNRQIAAMNKTDVCCDKCRRDKKRVRTTPIIFTATLYFEYLVRGGNTSTV